MKKTESDNLRELTWRSRLTLEKEARLQALMGAHPEAEAEIQEEVRLSQLLGQLPDAPVASNFTSQVLRAIEREEAKISREHKRGWPAWRVGFGWVSRLAIAGFSLFAAVIGILHHQYSVRSEFARHVEKVSLMAALPTDWLANFDTINRLDQTAPVDEELLAMLR